MVCLYLLNIHQVHVTYLHFNNYNILNVKRKQGQKLVGVAEDGV